MERIELRDRDIGKIRLDNGFQEGENSQIPPAIREKSMTEVIEEVEVLIDTHFFNGF